MQYAIEDLSPVKKKISVTVPAPEAGAAIDEAAAAYRGAVKLNGFRKGKVPAGIIEKRFGKEIVQQATDKLVEENLKEILSGKTFEAVSRLAFDGAFVERGKDFVYSLVFEVMPEFVFPDYEGVELEQAEAQLDEAAVDEVLLNMRRRLAQTVSLKEARKPRDGDVAHIDFAALDEDGSVLAGFTAENFRLTLGEGRSFPDFEELIKDLEIGEEKENSLTFPAGFINSTLAGRTVKMRIKLVDLHEKVLPAADDDFARESGNFESLAKMREGLCEAYLQNLEEANKEAAQKVFLDRLLEKTEFPVPDIMVENQVNVLVREFQDNMQRHGQKAEVIEEAGWEALRAQMRPEAERRARAQVLLLTLAKNLEFKIEEQDLDAYMRGLARQSGQELKTIREYYIRNNLLPGLANMLLADKAMAELYARARVVKVRPPVPSAGDKAADKDEAQGASLDGGEAQGGTEDAGD
ncbi:MAG: trigger factor [Desulfovibrio sp.]|jgi:trigger factor|nr:trigger factor [Desulfovibrio sp.]